MGRKNFQSIPEKYRPLPNRTNIILTRQQDFTAEGCEIVHELSDALELAQTNNDEELFVIGGGQVYDLALQAGCVDRMYLTWVHAEFEGDTWYPQVNFDEWKEISKEEHPKDEKHPYSFTICTYEKK